MRFGRLQFGCDGSRCQIATYAKAMDYKQDRLAAITSQETVIFLKSGHTSKHKSYDGKNSGAG